MSMALSVAWPTTLTPEPEHHMPPPRIPLPRDYLREQVLAFKAERNISDEDMAALLGVTRATFARIKKGDTNWTSRVRDLIQDFVARNPLGVVQEAAPIYNAEDLTIEVLCDLLRDSLDPRHPDFGYPEFSRLAGLRDHIDATLRAWVAQQR
jgi:transcriptional regulator with XRE-family HTH domain